MVNLVVGCHSMLIHCHRKFDTDIRDTELSKRGVFKLHRFQPKNRKTFHTNFVLRILSKAPDFVSLHSFSQSFLLDLRNYPVKLIELHRTHNNYNKTPAMHRDIFRQKYSASARIRTHDLMFAKQTHYQLRHGD